MPARTAKASLRSSPIAPSHLAARKGFTLVEILVVVAILLLLSSMVLFLINRAMELWRQGEREQRLADSAEAALHLLREDLRSCLTIEPRRVESPLVRFTGDYDGQGRQRLLFVRALEAGPERSVTLTAGDGLNNDDLWPPTKEELQQRPKPPQPPVSRAADREQYNGLDDDRDGRVDHDLMPLGGMMQVAYFLADASLYRSFQAPIQRPDIRPLADKSRAVPVAVNVLYFGVQYWVHSRTTSWEAPPCWRGQKAAATGGPSLVWDSTRGDAQVLGPDGKHRFVLYEPDSLPYPDDDVFPQAVRLELMVDLPGARGLTTELRRSLGPQEDRIQVLSTAGFPRQGYLLIGEEWLRYRDKDQVTFYVASGGRHVRGTAPAAHEAGATVRSGATFVDTVYLPTWREGHGAAPVWAGR